MRTGVFAEWIVPVDGPPVERGWILAEDGVVIDVGAGQEIDRLVRRSREFQTWLKTAGVVTVAPENSRIEEASE